MAYDPPLITIIIPTLNEADVIEKTIAAARTYPSVQILVADAGSTDDTRNRSKVAGARFLRSKPGRARQMNDAVRRAESDRLLFLHADTLLPHRYGNHVWSLLERPDVAAGAFRLKIDGPGLSLRVIEWGTNFRSRRLQMPYGDQAIFLRREVFEEVGGFPDMPLMEDYEFARRLRRIGRIAIAPAAVVTSARRWQSVGPWRTFLINQTIVAAYRLGVSPERLAAWYRKEKRGQVI